MQLTTKDALAQLKGLADKRFLEIFNDGKLSIEIYKPEKVDNQQPHTRD
jgi:hypothetical protein